ncbi:MAG TPA: M17 family peptidase N-terminal domain-containing protein [Polyangiaceae bacterium]|nr:M17 family peptidase N-terminal domain-containing protein [Polyangiaceae bacterium]
MELRFTTPNLRRLDLLASEVLVVTLTTDERPPHGTAGLVDWRLSGRISRLLLGGFATGRAGEVLLVPGKPKLPFDKVLLFGVGDSSSFDEGTYRALLDRILKTLEGLRVRTAVVELPGRHFGAIPAEQAADILLERTAGRREHDVWTLIEPADAQRAITQHMIQERRRVRTE